MKEFEKISNKIRKNIKRGTLEEHYMKIEVEVPDGMVCEKCTYFKEIHSYPCIYNCNLFDKIIKYDEGLGGYKKCEECLERGK